MTWMFGHTQTQPQCFLLWTKAIWQIADAAAVWHDSERVLLRDRYIWGTGSRVAALTSDAWSLWSERLCLGLSCVLDESTCSQAHTGVTKLK